MIAEYPPNEPEEGPEYGLLICNEDGKEIENATDRMLLNISHGRSLAVFSALYREARRRALGVDEAVDDLLGQLGGSSTLEGR
jgi:hypothetical protein